MKIKLTEIHADAPPLAVYESDHVPGVGDAVVLPGEPGLWEVEQRIWFPPREEMIVALRKRT
jgi:hypothetical protein